jgi:DNA-binding response OmpR family regulator
LKNDKNKQPGLILLDLRMPRMDGIEFLKVMKKEDNFRIIPVVVLTTSKEEEDKIESYNLGISGYMMKPVDYIDFVEVIRTIKMYWTLSESP